MRVYWALIPVVSRYYCSLVGSSLLLLLVLDGADLHVASLLSPIRQSNPKRTKVLFLQLLFLPANWHPDQNSDSILSAPPEILEPMVYYHHETVSVIPASAVPFCPC